MLISDQKLKRFLEGEAVSGEADSALRELESQLGASSPVVSERVLRAVAACRLGAPTDLVARFLDWKEFETFCASLLRARGYSVTENINLTKPRVQIDILARSTSVALLIDCKHWGHDMGAAALVKAAEAQAERAKAIRAKMRGLEPLIVVLLVLSNERARFVDGAAVVPVFALGSFLENYDAYRELLEFY